MPMPMPLAGHGQGQLPLCRLGALRFVQRAVLLLCTVLLLLNVRTAAGAATCTGHFVSVVDFTDRTLTPENSIGAPNGLWSRTQEVGRFITWSLVDAGVASLAAGTPIDLLWNTLSANGEAVMEIYVSDGDPVSGFWRLLLVDQLPMANDQQPLEQTTVVLPAPARYFKMLGRTANDNRFDAATFPCAPPAVPAVPVGLGCQTRPTRLVTAMTGASWRNEGALVLDPLVWPAFRAYAQVTGAYDYVVMELDALGRTTGATATIEARPSRAEVTNFRKVVFASAASSSGPWTAWSSPCRATSRLGTTCTFTFTATNTDGVPHTFIRIGIDTAYSTDIAAVTLSCGPTCASSTAGYASCSPFAPAAGGATRQCSTAQCDAQQCCTTTRQTCASFSSAACVAPFVPVADPTAIVCADSVCATSECCLRRTCAGFPSCDSSASANEELIANPESVVCADDACLRAECCTTATSAGSVTGGTPPPTPDGGTGVADNDDSSQQSSKKGMLLLGGAVGLLVVTALYFVVNNMRAHRQVTEHVRKMSLSVSQSRSRRGQASIDMQ